MTNPETPPNVDSVPVEALESALAELPADLAAGVMAKVLASAEEKTKTKELDIARIGVANMAVIAHINYAENTPDDFDDINSDRYLRDQSINILYKLGRLTPRQRDTFPDSVIDFASTFYVQREVNFGASTDEIESVIKPVGLDLDIMYARISQYLFDTGYFGQFNTVEELRKELPTLRILAHNARDGVIMPPLEKKMRLDLIDAGYKLPELDDNGSYGYDDEEEEHIFPEITDQHIPNDK